MGGGMKLNLIAPINSLGYGYTGLHVCDELIKKGVEVALFPIGNPQCHFRHQANIEQALKNADKFDSEADCVRIWHQHDMSMFVGRGRHIGFPIFELNMFTDKEKHHLRSCDELFVCSHWAKGVIEGSLIHNMPEWAGGTSDSRTNIVPLGVDTNIFTPKLSGRKNTIFLNVGKWEVRKGHDILIEAFKEAFPDNRDVELWMMCDNPFLNETQEGDWRYKYNDPRVHFIPRVESDEQVADVMRQADCGVFPSRAEGWNLEALEMLACGKEVIATNYSAHTEFLTKDNAWLMPINGLEGAYDGIWFKNQGDWAHIDESAYQALINSMTNVHFDKQQGLLKLNEEGIETAKQFTWENTASSIIEHLST
jgi:glycosyltransferase involved in cell wall biosynthesis